MGDHSSTLVGPVSAPSISAPAPTSAFNYTYGTGDIYTNTSAQVNPLSPPAGTRLKWFPTLRHTSDGSSVEGTAFNFTANSGGSPFRQEVNWTLPIPKTNCSTCSLVVQFTLLGNLTLHTSENFTLWSIRNNTSVLPTSFPSLSGVVVFQGPAQVCGTKQGLQTCDPTVQIPVDNKWTGYTLTLSFRFGWNATNQMQASVGEVTVASVDNLIKSSTSHLITQSSATKMMHNATLSLIGYNTTVQ